MNNTATQSTDLAPFAGQQEIRINVLLADLFGNVEADRAVSVIDAAFGRVVQNAVCIIDFSELNIDNRQSDFFKHTDQCVLFTTMREKN